MPTIASSAPSTTMPSILTPTPSVVAKVNQSTVEHILPHLNISTSDHDVQITEMFDTNFNETLKKYNISTQKQVKTFGSVYIKQDDK